MPELPEVETIRRQLIEKIKGKRVEQVEVRLPRLIKNVPSREFEKAICGVTALNIRRRAKLLVFDFSNGWSVIVHLKLTGQLIYEGKEGVGKPYIIYTFNDGSQLKHYDFRMFGYAKLFKSDEVERILEKEEFGPEPLDKNFTIDIFRARLKEKPNVRIKPLLLDQTFIAGIGNIYAQEACFFAGVLPERRAASLSEAEIKKLYAGLRQILTNAIERGGSSVDSYVDAAGERGAYVPLLKVYGREGEKCLKCGGIIKTIKLAGRGTSFCLNCQK